ncbi:DinB family protein [Flavobacteriaceae bacterium MAR_2010_72]|nr:DinB family protein [Flavobacteriaceae bacterium MAR_2010_72]TVZ59630.1 DinB family protein [Flavobacteriaceae bacterium MAR_2010_105]
MTKDNLKPDEFNPYYGTYINATAGLDLKNGLKVSGEHTINFLRTVPSEKLEYRYATGKWTVKEIIQHLIDSERVFAYRALRIAREDQTALPGFEQDDYVSPSKANTRSLDQLLNEYASVRQSNVALFESFSDRMLTHLGTASNSPVSVRAIGFIIMGHEIHHCGVIKERYLDN